MFVREPLTFQTKQHSHLLIQIVEDNEMKSFRLTVVLVLTVLFLTACPIKNSKPERSTLPTIVQIRTAIFFHIVSLEDREPFQAAFMNGQSADHSAILQLL